MKNRLVARLAARFPALGERLVARYRPRERDGEIPWTPPTKALSECRVAVITTAGIHHRGQRPFDMDDPEGDPTFRELDGETIFDDLAVTHDYYDHTDVEKDPNIVLPLDRLRELTGEGLLAGLTPVHFGFMGHIDGRHLTSLVEETAPAAASRLRAVGADAALLTPA